MKLNDEDEEEQSQLKDSRTEQSGALVHSISLLSQRLKIKWLIIAFSVACCLILGLVISKPQQPLLKPESLEVTILNNNIQRFESERKVRESVLIGFSKTTFTLSENSVRRPLVLYVYNENPKARVNTQFFIFHGLHSQADFVFILNGETDLDKALLPKNVPNIRIVRREQPSSSLGAIGEVLRSSDQALVKKYKHFILLDSNTRGPFLPSWSNTCWSDVFLDRLTEEVKLVGTTYGCQPGKHIESLPLATDDIGIKVLLKGNQTDTTFETNELFSADSGNPFSLAGLSMGPVTNRFEEISAEMSCTNLIYRANYKVAVLMTAAEISPDFYRNCLNQLDSSSLRFVHPYETVFINPDHRLNYDKLVVTKMTKFHDDAEYSSWEVCASSLIV